MLYDYNDIYLYIFNWKKVNQNSVKLYYDANKYIRNIKIINSDENFKLNDDIDRINLDDSFYYGGQYNIAIKDVKDGKIFGVISGDTIDVDFKALFENMLNTFNEYNTGIYTINDLRSSHIGIVDDLCNIKKLKILVNSDCGIWFINPLIVQILKKIHYHILSPFGWGIDVITCEECKKHNKLIIRDYSLECDQIDHSSGYNTDTARSGMHTIIKWYYENIL